MSDTLADVASRGDRLETLRALRDRLARELDLTASARDVAALSRQLTDVLQQIEDLTDPEEEKDDFAELIALPGMGG
jgi:hypothetical protein